MTVAFYVIRERVITQLYAGKFPILGVADAGGSTTTLVDAAAGLSGATADHFDYAWLKVRSTPTGAAPQGDVRTASEGGYAPSTGTFTVAPAFSATPPTNANYEVHRSYHPDEIDLAINQYLRNLYMPAFYPLSLDLLTGDDNDMEASGTAAFSASNATLSKITTQYFNGTQSLNVAATSANGFAAVGNSTPVVGSNAYYSAVMAQGLAANTTKLQIVDVTNGNAIILQNDPVAQLDWTEIILPWLAPLTCREIRPRFVSVTSGSSAVFDDYQMWAALPHIYPLPSWITRKEQVIDIVAYPHGVGQPPAGAFDYTSNIWKGERLLYRFERADVRATRQLQVWLSYIGPNRPYIIAYKPLSEVTADYPASSTTANTIPLSSSEGDLLADGVLGEMHQRMALQTTGEDKAHHIREALRLKEQYKTGLRHLIPEWRGRTVMHERAFGTVA